MVFGTGLAQVLPFLATPLLTRIFNEEDFATYTSFFALATIFSVGVGAKYQQAIVLPKSDLKAQKVFLLSVYLTIFYSVMLMLVFTALKPFGISPIGNLIFFIPLYVLFFGFWSSITNLSIRNKTFKFNAYSKVIQSISYIVLSIFIGLTSFMSNGLVLGKIFGTIFSAGFLFKKSPSSKKIYGITSLKAVAKEYVDYPKYGLAPAFLNTISSQALILFLTWFYLEEEIGQYGLTYMVLSAPLGLIGISYRDVFFQKVASLVINEQKAQAFSFFKKSAITLFAIGFPVCLILFFFGESIFSLVFGEKWQRSGLFASILSVSFLVRLVVSPLSAIFNATNTLKIAAIWQGIFFCTTFVVLGISVYFLKLDIESLLWVYMIHDTMLYLLYFVIQTRTMKRLIV